jgi:hypothetical protein
MRKPPQKKRSPTTLERLKKLEKIVRKQEQRIKDLEAEVKRLDIEEITEIDHLNKPQDTA